MRSPYDLNAEDRFVALESLFQPPCFITLAALVDPDSDHLADRMLVTAQLEAKASRRVGDRRAAELRFNDDRLPIGLANDDVGAARAVDEDALPLGVWPPTPDLRCEANRR